MVTYRKFALGICTSKADWQGCRDNGQRMPVTNQSDPKYQWPDTIALEAEIGAGYNSRVGVVEEDKRRFLKSRLWGLSVSSLS